MSTTTAVAATAATTIVVVDDIVFVVVVQGKELFQKGTRWFVADATKDQRCLMELVGMRVRKNGPLFLVVNGGRNLVPVSGGTIDVSHPMNCVGWNGGVELEGAVGVGVGVMRGSTSGGVVGQATEEGGGSADNPAEISLCKVNELTHPLKGKANMANDIRLVTNPKGKGQREDFERAHGDDFDADADADC